MYYIFDSIIYPRVSETIKQEAATPGLFSRGFGFFKTLLSGQKPEEATSAALATEKFDSIADVNLMRRTCLEIYLKNDLDMIRTGNYLTGNNLEGLVDYINSAYSSLLSPFIQDGKRYRERPRKWICQTLRHVRTIGHVCIFTV